MKKVILLIIVGFLLFSGTACTKKEGQQNQQNEQSQQSEQSQQNQEGQQNGQNQEQQSITPFKPDPGKKYPVVTIEMANGKTMKLELYPETAPNTVNNFISLVKKGFYNGLTFHRVIPGFMIQGGDPNGNGSGGPGYSIKGEFMANGVNNYLLHDRGVLSMARTDDPNSAGSQFFIMVEKAAYLDGQYAAFGKVIEGMDVADEIVNAEKDANDKPLKPQVMKKVTVDTRGQDYPEPEKVQ